MVNLDKRIAELKDLLDSLEFEAYRSGLHGLEAIANSARWELERYQPELDSAPPMKECPSCTAGDHYSIAPGEKCDCHCHENKILESQPLRMAQPEIRFGEQLSHLRNFLMCDFAEAR